MDFTQPIPETPVDYLTVPSEEPTAEQQVSNLTKQLEIASSLLQNINAILNDANESNAIHACRVIAGLIAMKVTVVK